MSRLEMVLQRLIPMVDFSRVVRTAVVALASVVAACSGDGPSIPVSARSEAVPAAGRSAEVRALTGAPTRVVWVQGDGTDPETEGDRLILMGLDSEDGKGERVILGKRGSYVKPRLTSRGDRIVFSTRIIPGPPEIFVVNFDGSGLKKLADGFAMALWQNPADGADWVYAGTENKKYDFAKVTRFPVDAPDKRELVWNTSLVSQEGFGVSPDGRQAGGMFPWPDAGIADLTRKTFKKVGEGCWTSLTSARGLLFWYFDGAHRNVTMVDVRSDAKWMVNIASAPGFDGAEASHPQWTNHPRFLTLTGPYNQGGANQVKSGGKQVEVHIGRFSADFSRIEAWARATENNGGDSDPTVWIDLARSPHPRRPSGPVGPPAAGGSAAGKAPAADPGRVVVNVRLARPGTIPNPQAILPYRHALVVNEYDVVGTVQGRYAAKQIRVAQWAIRDSRVLPEARKAPGAAFTLTVERYDAHPELEGERLISTSETSPLPLYYEIKR